MNKRIAFFYNSYRIHVVSYLSNKKRPYKSVIKDLLIDMRTALRSTDPNRQNCKHLYLPDE